MPPQCTRWYRRDVHASSPGVDLVVAVHDPRREIARAVGSALGSASVRRVIVVCHNTPPAGIAERLGSLASDPRVTGHTIVVWKPHAHDFTELDDAATGRLFTVCRDVARAIRRALPGVERVYQVTMCDGPVNHLHIQLIPRYAGTPIGSRRLVIRADRCSTARRRRPGSRPHLPNPRPTPTRAFGNSC